MFVVQVIAHHLQPGRRQVLAVELGNGAVPCVLTVTIH